MPPQSDVFETEDYSLCVQDKTSMFYTVSPTVNAKTEKKTSTITTDRKRRFSKHTPLHEGKYIENEGNCRWITVYLKTDFLESLFFSNNKIKPNKNLHEGICNYFAKIATCVFIKTKLHLRRNSRISRQGSFVLHCRIFDDSAHFGGKSDGWLVIMAGKRHTEN